MLARTLPKPTGRGRERPAQGPFLFLAIEAGRAVVGSARFRLSDVDAVVIGRGEARAATRTIDAGARTLRIDLPDPWMSQAHARITRSGDTLTFYDLGSRNGSLVNDAAAATVTLRDGDVLEVGGSFFVVRKALPDSGAADVVVPEAPASDWRMLLRTVHPGLAEGLADLVRIAASRVPVLLHGPTGAGKEVLARGVHAMSGRDGGLIAVNCGALPASLVESELFGYKRGAFSGAVGDKVGLVTAADRGTLFLDEIGDLPASMQPVLLRALAEHAVRPVGATEPVAVDFRLVAATNRDLRAMVAAGTFREDLYARIAGFTIDLPSLAARREDLATLIADLGARLAPGRSIVLGADAARALLRYDWPRNIRQLEKVLASAIALAGDAPIELAHLRDLEPAARPAAPTLTAPPDDDDDPRRAELVAALAAHGGNVSAAARALGRPRSQIQRWMRRWGLRGGD